MEEQRIEPGRLLLEDVDFVEDEELWLDEGGDDHSGWSCVRTDPFPCPAAGCTFVAVFMTAAHLILVWEQRDDPNLLRHAQRAKEVGRNPRIVGYESSFVPSASYWGPTEARAMMKRTCDVVLLWPEYVFVAPRSLKKFW